jgi:peptide/nickel transport system substrate-binding protein
MEGRFAVKDFVVIVLIVIVGIMVFLAMQQFDRQWDHVQQIQTELRDQRNELRDELREIQRLLAEAAPGGAAVEGAGGAAPGELAPGELAPGDAAGEGEPAEAADDDAGGQGDAADGAIGLPDAVAVAAADDVDDAAVEAELARFSSADSDPFSRQRAAQRRQGYARGDWLVEAFSGQVAKLTPLLSGDANASNVQSHVLESLAVRDPDTLEWKPLLARDWQISEDGLEITFQLREGVRFSDGVPLTADDVVFTFNFIMDERIAAPRHRAYYQKIESVEKLGPMEVRFKYGEPYFESFGLAASMDVLPKHFYGEYSTQAFNASVGLLMGSGPYRMENPRGWRPGQLIRLVRNERYWGVQPSFDRIVYREISNDTARLTSFRNGEHDTFAAQPEQYHDLIKDESLVGRTHQFEFQNPIGGYRFVAWNQQRNGRPTHFADRRVRQAMTMLIDRDRLIDEVMLGYAATATGPFNPGGKQFNPEVEPWPYDPERAMALLVEAGFEERTVGTSRTLHVLLILIGLVGAARLSLVGRPGYLLAAGVVAVGVAGVVLAVIPPREVREGVLRGPDGEPFEFRLTYPSGSANYDRMVLMLKDSYARAGIILEPDPLEWAVFTDRLNNKNFEAISLGWTSGIETDIYQMFHSEQALEGGDNFMTYLNPELDSVLEQARTTVQEEERIPHWHRAHEILHEDQPYMFLFFGKSLIFIDDRIENIELTRLGLNPRYEWFVPRQRQRWTR